MMGLAQIASAAILGRLRTNPSASVISNAMLMTCYTHPH
ncbi:hypothetical protein J2W42_005850 [Rhizobium tibeticum]|nr:hypothetical protein [Rhizobium tibeticum]